MTDAKRADETVEGGAYLVNGRWVNAHGEPIADPNKKPAPKAEKPDDDGKKAE